eukprot:scaffold4011_cov197-Ochromonas_danica.AAC.12
MSSKSTDEAEEPMRQLVTHKATFTELVFFGLLVFGKVFSFWTMGFSMGYWQFLISLSLACVTYLCFASSVAEMSSILPFSGGSYGYVRCVLGPFLGFIVGLFESLEYIMFLSSTLVDVGLLLGSLLHSGQNLQPLYWLLFHLLAIPAHLMGGSLFWRVSMFLSLWLVGILVVYLLASAVRADPMPSTDLTAHPSATLHFYSSAGWCFKGLEVLTLTCEHTSEPAKRVPRAMVSSAAIMAVLLLSTFAAMGSLPPGPEILKSSLMPFAQSMEEALRGSQTLVHLLLLPALLGTVHCFLFAASQQLRAMACSGLVPADLKQPWVSVVAVCTLSLCVELSLFYSQPSSYRSVLFSLAMLAAIPVYICLMVSYCIYSTKFSGLDRFYRSPVGQYGAFFAIGAFAISALTLIAFPKERTISTTFFCVWTSLAVAYYFRVAESRQCFSREEQLRFFRIYISNITRKQRLARQRSKLSTRSLRNFLKAVVRNRAGAAYIYPSALQSVFTSRREGFATAADDTPSERLSVGTVVPEEIIHHHPVQRRPMQQVRDDSYTLIQTFGACQECEEPQACQEEMPSLVSMSVAE